VSSAPSILLVDDNGDDVVIALRALRRSGLGVEIRTARNGREALDALRLAEPRAAGAATPGGGAPEPVRVRPRVIFLDLKMPQPDGFEVLARLRREDATRAIPVVVVSSSARPEDIRRSYELGANSYLVKRFDPHEPGSYLAEAARYWVELNQVSPR
jgi:two-component system response regulator